MPKPKRCADCDKLATVLGTLISWMAQSSVAPISLHEASRLLQMLELPRPKREKEAKRGKA